MTMMMTTRRIARTLCHLALLAASASPLSACTTECEYDGRTYAVGDRFKAADGCNSCSCESGGEIACTLVGCTDAGGDPGDAGGGDAGIDGGIGTGMCPAAPAIDGACKGSAHCEYGEESCCGKTYPSTVCDCSGGTFSCYATDACFLPPGACGDASTPDDGGKGGDGSAPGDGGDSCPANPPIGLTCSGSSHCEFGTETCCGKTYPSTVCDCQGGNWSCYATDACALPPGACDSGV